LNITIEDDDRLENNELVSIVAVPPDLPDGYERCEANLMIMDDDGK